MREAQGLEGAIDRIVRHREPELLIQPHDQIARPPAHHAMDRSDWALLYDAGEKGLMTNVELGRHPRRRNIDETVRSLLVEPDHPVPQRLTIHAANLRRLFPRGAVEHGRNRKQPSRLRRIFRSLGKPANLAGGIVRPHRNGLTHGKPPQFAILNMPRSIRESRESQPLSGLVLLAFGHGIRRRANPYGCPSTSFTWATALGRSFLISSPGMR